jgi:hypothetical protein
VGTRGASAAHLGYISRLSAVREPDGTATMLAWNLPDEVTRAGTYDELRDNLRAWATVLEDEARGRTHYRGTFSFEQREVDSATARAMVGEWLEEVFPRARAVGFVHSNTEHPHVHLWLDARGTDGKKLDISPRQFRSLDETWNRIYCRHTGRNEREHLDKKAETLAYKRAVAQEKAHDRSERQQSGRASSVTLQHPGHASVTKQREGRRGADGRSAQGGPGGGNRTAAERASGGAQTLSGPVDGERALGRLAALGERAIRETHHLREVIARLGEQHERQEQQHGRPEEMTHRQPGKGDQERERE